MKKVILLLLVVCMALASNTFVFAAEPVTNYKSNEYKDFITYNSPLTNTYKRLTEDKSLNIVYFGGSVTVGIGAKNASGQSTAGTDSWRALTAKWFKDNFPSATINSYNAAIGATGTFLGAIRLQSDVLSKKPDLVFIEFAINDTYCGLSKEKAAQNFETIVREIRNFNPECDIITILTTDQSKAAEYPFPAIYDAAAAHAEISNAYNIPVINVGQAVVVGCLYGNVNSDDWKTYFSDTVHPTSEGYKEYYNCIEEYLTNSLVNTDFTGCEKAHHKMSNVVSKYLFDGDRRTYEGALMESLVEEAVGFKLDTNTTWQSYPDHTGFYHTKDTENASITIKFTGTELTLWTNLSNASSVTYILDGEEEKDYTFTSNGPRAMLTNLESSEHTITIKPKVIQADVSEFRLYAICTRDATKASVKGTPFSHTHFLLDDSWNKDDNEHYQICNCGEKFNVAAHDFSDWVISKEATETTDGMRKRTCETCGKTEVEKFSLNATADPVESTPAESTPTDDVDGDVSSFPVIPVAIGGGVLVVIAIVVIILVSKKKK